MGKQKAQTAPSFMQEMVRPGLYKRSQGRITRQVTFIAIFTAFGLGSWSLFEMHMLPAGLQYPLPLLIVVAGAWLAYRLVNLPRFADFLIAVEAEMNKVSWPSKEELIRSSIVVIFVIFVMALLLFIYDLLWRILFQFLGIIP